MGKIHRRAAKRIRECPNCGSIFVDWCPYMKRFRCLVYACGWHEAEESDPGKYNYATGSTWVPALKGRPKL